MLDTTGQLLNRIDEEGSGWAGYGDKRFTLRGTEWASPIDIEGALL